MKKNTRLRQAKSVAKRVKRRVTRFFTDQDLYRVFSGLVEKERRRPTNYEAECREIKLITGYNRIDHSNRDSERIVIRRVS